MSLLATLNGFVSFNADGSIDTDRTASAVIAQIRADLEAARDLDGRIEAQVHALFDQLPKGSGIETGDVVSHVSLALAGGSFAVSKANRYADAVKDYLARTPHFKGFRGAGGGLKRLADLV